MPAIRLRPCGVFARGGIDRVPRGRSPDASVTGTMRADALLVRGRQSSGQPLRTLDGSVAEADDRLVGLVTPENVVGTATVRTARAAGSAFAELSAASRK